MLSLRLLPVLTSCLAVAACVATEPSGAARQPGGGSEMFGDLSARRPNTQRDRPIPGAVVAADRSEGRSWTMGPAEPVTTAGTTGASRTLAGGLLDEDEPGGTFKLNFERAEIRDVVRTVLNDTLGLNYTMSADVAGKITISSARLLNRTELLSILENVLAGQGFSMTNAGGVYNIAPSAAGAGAVDVGAGLTPGYGVSIVPLRHVSVATMNRLVSGFITDADKVKVETARNAVIVRGSSAKREEAVQAIMAFDADWMRGQTVSMFEVRRGRPEAIIAELSQVFDTGENGASAGVIQFKPVHRQRAILAVSKNPTLIKRAEILIRKLDSENESAAENVFVYRARYRDVKELARIVSSLFSAGGDAGKGQTSGSRFGDKPGKTPSMMSPNGDRNGDGAGGLSAGLAGSGGRGASSSGSSEKRDWGNTFATAFGDKNSGLSGGEGGSGAPDLLDLTRKNGAEQRISVSADAASNSVITYADGETYRKIHAALRQLDSAPLQVAVNVMIAEVQLNDELRYGLQYFVGSDRAGLGKDKASFGLFNQAANVLQKQIPGFNFLVGANATPDIIISALDNITDVKILSSPSLVVLENQTATLQVGDAIPITTRQAQSVELANAPVVNQIEFRDTGIILNVTPRIGQNDAVTMNIDQEISSVTRAGDTLTPTISKRKVSSAISVVSGQTVLLAGLISEKSQNGRTGIPGLGRVPVLGDLFSTTENGSGRTELVVFIRPVVVRNGDDAQTVAEEFRSRLQNAAPPRAFKPAPSQPVVFKQ